MSLAHALRDQATHCEALGSPFMARLMTLLADRLTPDHGPVAARLFRWPGDVSAGGASLPLRLAGGLHALRLRGHAGLAAAYPPSDVPDDALWRAVSAAMTDEAAFLLDWISGPPQTNELRRSAALRAVGHWLTAQWGLPLDLRELGASAGLNLNWDRYGMIADGVRFGPDDPVLTLAPDWTGPLPADAEPTVAARRGVDLNPLSSDRDALRLMAYLWPDQTDRLDRMRAALTLPANRVDRACAADWLEALAPQPTGTARLIFHTVAWQYFPPDVQARARAAIERLGARASKSAPLAWFGMEGDGGGPGAALTLRLWPDPGRVPHLAGRADFHGRWIDWRLARDGRRASLLATRRPAMTDATPDPTTARNVEGTELRPCSTDPMTGFFRDGCCNTGPMDTGVHTVCATMTAEFLAHSKYLGNDLSTPRPEFGFPGLRPGDKWCLCAARFLQAHEEGVAPAADLSATHERTLDIVPMDVLRRYADG